MQPYLYTIVEEQKIREILEAFYSCLNLPIHALDENGRVLTGFGEVSPYCTRFQKMLPPETKPDKTCQDLHAKSARRAMAQGEAYVFCCHANLNHIIFPLINKNTLFGAILIGPFLLDEPDSALIIEVARNYGLPIERALDLFEIIETVPVISAEKATRICRLLSYTFAPLIPDAQQKMTDNYNKMLQQARINASIQKYKAASQNENDAPSYPFEKEKLLTRYVRERNGEKALQVLNELLGYMYYERGDPKNVILTRVTELCSLLSRAAIEGGANADVALSISDEFLNNLSPDSSQEEVCLQFQKTIEQFMGCMFAATTKKSNEVIKSAIQYIHRNYSRPLTLEDAAAHVRLTPSYFSTLFKQSCGSSFREYLNYVRIEESKHLLTNTEYPILDIAIAVGFDDQSYFTHVFKKYTGLTPKQYRR